MRMCSREQEDAQYEMTLGEMRAMYDDTPARKVVPKKEPYEFRPHEGPYDLTGWDEILERARINRARLAKKRGLK